jgi:hypothetical protein
VGSTERPSQGEQFLGAEKDIDSGDNARRVLRRRIVNVKLPPRRMRMSTLSRILASAAVVLASVCGAQAATNWYPTTPANMRIAQKDTSNTSNPRAFVGDGSVQAAINDCALMTGLSDSNRCLVKVMPGTYTLTTPLQMHQYVDVDGSGATDTTITSAIRLDAWRADPPPSEATLVMAGNSKLSNLRVQNNNPQAGLAVVFPNGTDSAMIENVTVNASGQGDPTLNLGYVGIWIGANPYSPHAELGGNIVLKNVNVTSTWSSAVDDTHSTKSYGIFSGDSWVLVQNSNIVAKGSGQAYGIYGELQNNGFYIYDSYTEGSSLTGGTGTAAGAMAGSGGVHLIKSKAYAYGSPNGTCHAFNGGALLWSEALVGWADGSDCLNKATHTNNGFPCMSTSSTLTGGAAYTTCGLSSCWDGNLTAIPNQP